MTTRRRETDTVRVLSYMGQDRFKVMRGGLNAREVEVTTFKTNWGWGGAGRDGLRI